MKTEILRLDDGVLAKLREKFAEQDILLDAPRGDGFQPSYVPWDKVAQRLDEVFGGSWCFEIIRWDFVQNVWVVHGRLTVGVLIHDKGTEPYKQVLVKDGIGTAMLTSRGGQVDPGVDLKAAASDALKRCAVLLGVAAHLYSKDGQVRALEQQAATIKPEEPITPWELRDLRAIMATYGYPESYWCDQLGVKKLEDLPRIVFRQICDRTHPFVQFLDQHRQSANQAHRPPGLAVSDA